MTFIFHLFFAGVVKSSAKSCCCFLKFIYSEKATKFCKISTLLFSYVVPVKSKAEILQNFVAFSGYMNFSISQGIRPIPELFLSILVFSLVAVCKCIRGAVWYVTSKASKAIFFCQIAMCSSRFSRFTIFLYLCNSSSNHDLQMDTDSWG